MVQHIAAGNPVENKYQLLRKTDDHLRAEIKISGDDLGYQFRLREINGDRGCFFVSENSAVLKILNVGSILDMKYWTAQKTRRVKYVRAEINHIAKQTHEPFKGHYKVGLSILQTKGMNQIHPRDGWPKMGRVTESLKKKQRARQGF